MRTLLLTALLALTGVSVPILAQPGSTQTAPDPTYVLDLNRAKNLARQAAERLNGGLNVYRTEPSMHGPAVEAPYVDNGNGTWTFTFTGSRPGSTTPYVQSAVTVVRGSWRVTVDYNRPVRRR